MATSFNAFQEAHRCFREGTQFVSDLTFDQWSKKPEDHKAAILFVQFYNQITMAWYKAAERYPFIYEEDALSIAMQYLQKQVDRNLMTEERFTPQYIYQVAWNCISGLGWCERSQKRLTHEVSEVVETGEGQLSLYDTVASDKGMDEVLREEELTNLVATLDPKYQKVLNHLMNGESLRKVSKRSKLHGIDPLTSVEVRDDEVPEILENLKNIFRSYALEKGYALA